MRSPYQRPRRRRIGLPQLLLLSVGVILIVLGWQQISQTSAPPPPPTIPPGVTPTMPQSLSSSDVLPTPTPAPHAPVRTITFPGARLTSPIINAARTRESWETRYLGDSVGHLEGTAWIGEPGGNVVLAGHVESAFGTPGPFAYLFEAQIGDQIILGEDGRETVYVVTAIEEADPQAMEYVAQDGTPRLTLITCDNWDYEAQQYQSRLIVVAEPLPAE